ncbi:hypothetical protein BGZ60DRAFT_241346 [Tricladium varicosporioides]|nr:hypothetical protein BGZ60DRAFT_241346 [Hymenoscyphus varicosporioides]
MTHFLLPTLITSSLYSRLPSSLTLVILTLASRSRATFKLCATSFPLVAASCTWPNARRWAGGSPTHGSLTGVHAGMRGIGGTTQSRAGYSDSESSISPGIVLLKMVVSGVGLRCLVSECGGGAQSWFLEFGYFHR